jgi:hypothetical protein
VLVLKDAVKHQELLAAAVGVGREMAVRGVVDDGGGARHLVPDAVEHAPVHPLDRRGHPVQPRRVHRCASVEVRVEVHGGGGGALDRVEVIRLGGDLAELDLFDLFDELDVGRGGDADFLALGGDHPIDEVDLGAPALQHVLTH